MDIDDNLFEAIVAGVNAIYESENPFPNTAMINRDGSPVIFYHGSKNDFDEFSDSMIGSSTDAGWLGRGFYFYTNPQEASQYGNVRKFYLNIEDPYYATGEDNERLAELNDPEASAEFTQQLIDEGYDGVYYNGNLRGETVVFDKSQIKEIKEPLPESINSWDPNVSPVTPFTNPVGEPMGDYKRLFKQLPSHIGAVGTGGDMGGASYRYGESLPKVSRDIAEETQDEWEDAPHFPKFYKKSNQTTKRLMKKAGEHMPLGAQTSGDQIAYYTNMSHMGMYDMDYTKQGSSVGTPGP